MRERFPKGTVSHNKGHCGGDRRFSTQIGNLPVCFFEGNDSSGQLIDFFGQGVFYPAVKAVSHTLLLGDFSRVRFDRVPRNNPHRHNYFEPCYVISGTGDFVHEDEHFELQPGDLFIANPGSVHEITSIKTRDLNLCYTRFAIVEKSPADQRESQEDKIIQRFINAHQLKVSQQQHIGRGFRFFSRMGVSKRGGQSAYFTAQFWKVVILQIMTALAQIDETEASEHPVLERIRHLIALHPACTVSEIAKMSGVSERSMRRLFYEKLGRTVIREIHEQRINNASALLALPELSIAEVGQRIGIDDPGQFTRFFKKGMGITPREFRRQELTRSVETRHWVTAGSLASQTDFL